MGQAWRGMARQEGKVKEGKEKKTQRTYISRVEPGVVE
jgi:hypothetical protein